MEYLDTQSCLANLHAELDGATGICRDEYIRFGRLQVSNLVLTKLIRESGLGQEITAGGAAADIVAGQLEDFQIRDGTQQVRCAVIFARTRGVNGCFCWQRCKFNRERKIIQVVEYKFRDCLNGYPADILLNQFEMTAGGQGDECLCPAGFEQSAVVLA